MIDIPAKCIGCPELTKLTAEKDSASKLLDSTASALDVTTEELANKILTDGLDATEALTGVPSRMIEETQTLMVDALRNRPWAQKMTFAQYLEAAYETREPSQFRTLIQMAPWEFTYDIPFDVAIGMFNEGRKRMEAEIEAQGGDATQRQISDVTTRTYDVVNNLATQIDNANSRMLALLEDCEDGVQTEKRFFKVRRACGSIAVGSVQA